MSRHTLGPWAVDPPMVPNCLSIREARPGAYLLATVWKDDKPGLMEADAKLIAAAPDLLAACQALLASRMLNLSLDDELRQMLDDVVKKTADAVAKAVAEPETPGAQKKTARRS